MACRRCGEKGHWPSECDNPRLQANSNDDTSNTSNQSSGNRQAAATLVTSGTIEEDDEEGLDDIIVGFQFFTKGDGITLKTGEGPNIPKTWILLARQSWTFSEQEPPSEHQRRRGYNGHTLHRRSDHHKVGG